MTRRVYLGGSCGATDWRRTIAIPVLEQAGISYVDPQLAPGAWTEEYGRVVEGADKATCDVFLWVITATTRGVASVAEAASYISGRRPFALALEMIEEHSLVDGRRLPSSERDDLNRGRVFLRTVAEEHGVPVFARIGDAVDHAVTLCRSEKTRLAVAQVVEIVRKIECRDYRFVVTPTSAGVFLQAEAFVPDARSAIPSWQAGRRWFVEPDATATDVVRMAFNALLAWEEHELREAFHYDGVRVFTPH